MLLDFKIKNYKSFYKENELNMFADMAKREKRDILISLKKGINKKVLPSMVIYGSNASGKTTLVSAIDMLKEIVINGNIKKQSNNLIIKKMDLVPFIHDSKKQNEPICFDITFQIDNTIYNYMLNIQIDNIMWDRKITREELNVIEYKKKGSSIVENKNNIFTRTETDINISEKNLEIYTNENFNNLREIEKNLNKNIDKESLFLTTGFKSMISLNMENDILSWFENNLITVVDFASKKPIINVEGVDVNGKNVIYRSKTLSDLLKQADFGPQEIGYKKDEKTGIFSLVSVYKNAVGEFLTNVEDMESRGTIKLTGFWIEFIDKFKKRRNIYNG